MTIYHEKSFEDDTSTSCLQKYALKSGKKELEVVQPLIFKTHQVQLTCSSNPVQKCPYEK